MTSLLDLFGSFSLWEGSKMGLLQPLRVLLSASLFAWLLSDEYARCVPKCLESLLVDVALLCTVKILQCHLQIKI